MSDIRTNASPAELKAKSDRELVTQILTRLKEMVAARKLKESVWQEITDYLYPRRSGWDFISDRDHKVGEMIFDGESIAALNRLADGLFGWMASPSIDFINLRPKDRKLESNKKVMMHARDLEHALYDSYRSSNFYDALAEDITDCCALGTSTLVLEEDEKNERIVYEPLHLRETYISENRYGEVDTLFRVFDITNRVLLETYNEPTDGISAKERLRLSKMPEQRSLILHAMYPSGKIGGILTKNMEYKSITILLGAVEGAVNIGQFIESKKEKGLIRNSGMKRRIFETWRFRKAAHEAWGWSPAMDAIYDIKMLNIQSKTMIDTAQLAAKPPMVTQESMRGRMKIRPGSVMYTNGETISPLQTSYNYPLAMDSMERRARIVREHFKTDFFMSISQMQSSSRERTREEILQIKAESAAVLGSIVGRIQSERLDPITRLTLAMEGEAGRLPPVPKGIDPGIEMDLSFVGPLAMAQRKYVRLQGLNQGMGAIAGLVNIFGPDITLIADGNAVGREVLTANGVPAEFLHEPKVVEQRQKAAQQARQAQAEAEMQLERDKIMAKANKAPEAGSLQERAMEEV